MNKSDTLSLITTFIELCIFCINENGDIKKLIINTKKDFDITKVKNIYEIFAKDSGERVKDMLYTDTEKEEENLKIKSSYGINNDVNVSIKRIKGNIYICLKFVKSSKERDVKYKERLNELEITASMDHMTQLLNRHGYWNRVEKLLYLGDSEKVIGIIFIDVDKLKQVNDTLGHNGGDKALKQISNLISSNLRSRDIAVRYGGDEFIIIVEEITGSKSTAYGLAKRLVRNINKNKKYFLSTISVGVYTVKIKNFKKYLYNKNKLKNEWDKAIDIADKMAYKAKQSGGNEVVYFEKS